MASNTCCQVVGDLKITGIGGCIISVNVDSSTEMIDDCNDIKTGPTVGTISLTGYASDNVYIGCSSSAGVTIRWLQRYDCEKNVLYFINAGQGESFISGETSGSSFTGGGSAHSYVSLNRSSGRTYQVLQASASSGPASMYIQNSKLDGYGMTYTGDIFKFNTSSSMEFNNFLGLGSGKLYLKSFNLSFNSGALPIASYAFAFSIT